MLMHACQIQLLYPPPLPPGQGVVELVDDLISEHLPHALQLLPLALTGLFMWRLPSTLQQRQGAGAPAGAAALVAAAWARMLADESFDDISATMLVGGGGGGWGGVARQEGGARGSVEARLSPDCTQLALHCGWRLANPSPL